MQLGFSGSDLGPTPGRTPAEFETPESNFVHKPELTELKPEEMHHWTKRVINSRKNKPLYHQALN
eukprot:11328659-Karenia_brevis.AAC.1